MIAAICAPWDHYPTAGRTEVRTSATASRMDAGYARVASASAFVSSRTAERRRDQPPKRVTRRTKPTSVIGT
jgi:hypothetical protein